MDKRTRFEIASKDSLRNSLADIALMFKYRYRYGRRMILQNLQIRKICIIIPFVPCQQSITVQLGKSADDKIRKNVLSECDTAVTMRAFQSDGLSTGRTNEPTPFEIFTPFSTCKKISVYTKMYTAFCLIRT